MSIKYKQSWNEQMSTETPLLLPHYDWCNHCWMKKKVSHPITFLPCFSPLFNFRVSQVVPSIQAISTHSFPQIHDSNRHLNNSTLYFFYPKLLPARFWNTGLKTTVKEKKNTMQVICISHPHDNVPPLSNRLPGKKKKEVRRWDLKRGWSSVGQRRAESSPDPGNTSEILWNHRKGKRRD